MTINKAGYNVLFGGKLEHIDIAEKILGHPLPQGAEVHHVNEIRSDNTHSNLVICPNHDYHFMLHMRAKAYDACGHADWRKCRHCKEWDDPQNLTEIVRIRAGRSFHHKSCHAAAETSRYRAKKLIKQE